MEFLVRIMMYCDSVFLVKLCDIFLILKFWDGGDCVWKKYCVVVLFDCFFGIFFIVWF